MKKVIASLILCFFALQAETPKNSQTFLFTRPGQQNLCLKQAIWHNLFYDKEKRNAFDLAVYHQKSTHPNKIQAYFLPSNRTQLLVNTTALNRDILPYWLQLPTNFNGVLRINPTQTQTGFTLEGRRYLGNFLNLGSVAGFKLFQDWCAFITASFNAVKNNWGLSQDNVSGTGPTTAPVYDILTAFDNPEWAFYKSNGSNTQNQLSEIRIGLNTTFISTPRAQVATYSGFTIPCTRKPSNKYIFAAQSGYNAHFGLVWGISFQFPLNRENENYRLAGTINFENIFLLRNHQFRTFDLYGKQWSRFLLLRKQNDPTNTLIPGVNILTHKVRVSPHNIMDFGTGLRFTKNWFEAELGYGLWGNKGERCRIYNKNWVPEYGIAGSTINTSASTSTISTQGPDDPVFVPIVQNDINLYSGQSTASATHKVYGSLGIKRLTDSCDNTFNVGAVVEIPHNDTDVLSTWGIWVSAGIAF